MGGRICPATTAAGAQAETANLARRDVDVVGAGQIVVIGAAQEAEAVGQDFERAFAEHQAVLLDALLEDLEDQVLFSTFLNLWTIEDDILVGVDLQYTALFRLACPDALYYSEAESAQHTTALGRLLDSLPDNTTAQLLVQVRWDGGREIESYAAAERPAGDMIRFMVDARLSLLRQKPFKRVTHYLAITTYPDQTDLSKTRLKKLAMTLPDHGKDLKTQHARRMSELRKVIGNVLTSLRDAKVTAEPLRRAQIIAYLYERLNPAAARITEAPAIQDTTTLRSQIALNACDNVLRPHDH